MACSASAPPRCLSPLRLRYFRRLWLADMVSLLGDWAGRLALAVLVLERTGSPAWAAAVTAVSLAGFVGHRPGARHLRRPLRPRRRDARRRRRAGRRSSLAMLLPIPVGGLLVLAFLAGLATPPFEAARSAALPDLVPEEPLRRGAGALGHLGAVVARDRLRPRRAAAHGGRAGDGARHQRLQLPRVGGPAARAPPHRGRRAGRGARHASASRSATAPRRCSGSPGAPRARDRRRHRRARHRRRGARRALRRRGRPARRAPSACWPRRSRSAPCSAPPRSPRAPATTTASSATPPGAGRSPRPPPRRCSGWRRAAPSPSSPSPSPAGSSRCRSPPTR